MRLVDNQERVVFSRLSEKKLFQGIINCVKCCWISQVRKGLRPREELESIHSTNTCRLPWPDTVVSTENTVVNLTSQSSS